jgi:hypothetical protein
VSQIRWRTTRFARAGPVPLERHRWSARRHTPDGNNTSVAKWISLAVNEGYDKGEILNDADIGSYIEAPEIKKVLT